MLMSAAIVAAMKAALTDPDSGWAFTSAHETFHNETTSNGMGSLTTTIHRSVSVMLENAAQQKALVCFLDGDVGAPATKLAILMFGSRMETEDTQLIQFFENAIVLLEPKVEEAALEFFGG